MKQHYELSIVRTYKWLFFSKCDTQKYICNTSRLFQQRKYCQKNEKTKKIEENDDNVLFCGETKEKMKKKIYSAHANVNVILVTGYLVVGRITCFFISKKSTRAHSRQKNYIVKVKKA